jgi:hypothetical protein
MWVLFHGHGQAVDGLRVRGGDQRGLAEGQPLAEFVT